MPAKSRFTRLDAFTKTVEDARIRTTSGGIVTIVSLLVVFYLVWGEWSDYRRVEIHPELVVDKGRGEKMEIYLNITFPSMPCELLTLDVMDVSGEQQTGVMHGIDKVRLAPGSGGGHVIDIKALDLHSPDDAAKHLDPAYCGQCYGAPAPAVAKKAGCCNTCDEVREAYATVSWAFGHGENVEQCEREGYGQRLEAQRREGCRIEGGIRVNKVAGNFHLAPGRSFSNGNLHVHDLNLYYETPEDAKHTFTHHVHYLRFGPPLPESLKSEKGEEKKKQKSGQGGLVTKTMMHWSSNQHVNPLDDTQQTTDDPAFNYEYFVKVVPTSYLALGWEHRPSMMEWFKSIPDDLIGLGSYGKGYDGSVETHQYSVTSHKRSLSGGDDSKEGHQERIHVRGGIPGVFFTYDISPMKVINRESRPRSFTAFLTGVCAVIGGTLTVAAAIDRALYEGAIRVKKIHLQ